MQLSSSQSSLIASIPYFFVLHKNASDTELAAAVRSMNVPTGSVQYIPEPSSVFALGLAGGLFAVGYRRRGGRS
jgi:hypothetical protein